MVSRFVHWLGRLRVGRKLALIYLLDLSAVIYVSGILIHEKLTAIDFTQKEVVGSAYTEAVRQNLMGVLLGQQDLTLPRQRLDSERRALDAVLHTAEQAERFEQALEAAQVTSGASRPVAQAELVRRARDLLTTVANQSNLILDPDLDSYYVMSLTLLRYPELLQLLHESPAAAGGESGRVASRQVELLTVAGRFDAITQGIESDYIQAWGASDDKLRHALAPSRDALLGALKARGLKKGLATLCIGGGEATAVALEVL